MTDQPTGERDNCEPDSLLDTTCNRGTRHCPIPHVEPNTQGGDREVKHEPNEYKAAALFALGLPDDATPADICDAATKLEADADIYRHRLADALRRCDARVAVAEEVANRNSLEAAHQQAQHAALVEAAREAMPIIESCAGKTNAGLETVNRLRSALAALESK